jgi:TonB family protein
MHPPTEPAKRRLSSILLSAGSHLSVLALALLLGSAARNRTRLIQPAPPLAVAQLEISGGSHAVRIPLPALPEATHTRHPDPDADVTRKTILPVQQPRPKVSGGGAPPKPQAGNGSGQAALGNGSDAEDAYPAFPVFSPHPPVTDRSLLPASQQKIIVDVDIDSLGQVVTEKLVKGIGNQLDQIVLDIVKTWRFQPATINGKPVPTQAELIFPFDQSYPIAVS